MPLFYALVFWNLRHMGSSSLTRDWTHDPCIGGQCLNHWPTRDVPLLSFVLKQNTYFPGGGTGWSSSGKKKKDCVYISALTLDSHFIPVYYFLFYFFRFYWSIVALQPRVNFCHPAEWFSCTHIYLLFPPSSPLGFIPGYRLSLLPWLFRWQRMCLQCRRHRFGKIRVGNIPWRRACQPTAVFLPGESHGQRRLEGYGPWGPRRVRHDWPTNTDWLLKEYTCFKL